MSILRSFVLRMLTERLFCVKDYQAIKNGGQTQVRRFIQKNIMIGVRIIRLRVP